MAALSTVKGVALLTGGGAARVHCLCASLELYVQDLSDHETRTWRKGSSQHTELFTRGSERNSVKSSWKEPQ
jgi:hypothetical protein